MKPTLKILAINFVCLIFASCGYQRKPEKEQMEVPKITAKSVMANLEETLKKKSDEDYVEVDLLDAGQTQYFFPLNFLDVADVKEGYAIQGKRVTQSALIMIIEAQNADAAKNLEKCMEKVLSEQIRIWSDYLPAEYDYVKNNKIEREGNFIAYITSKYADALKETFDKSVE
ncbi:MAG: DUF4358 domain-containing protein [Turicibacter sp.]|nr:DUF4358 domain-containing protein [Turicibacter sp.]